MRKITQEATEQHQRVIKRGGGGGGIRQEELTRGSVVECWVKGVLYLITNVEGVFHDAHLEHRLAELGLGGLHDGKATLLPGLLQVSKETHFLLVAVLVGGD